MLAHLGRASARCERIPSSADIYLSAEESAAPPNPRPDPALVREVLQFSRLPASFLSRFLAQPIVLCRHIATPNRELVHFLLLASTLGRPPLVCTMPEDRFTPGANPQKRRLAKLPIDTGAGRVRNITVACFNEMAGRRFSEVLCIDGTPLAALHSELLDIMVPEAARPLVVDATALWNRDAPAAYYERFFALFTCLGVLAESYAVAGYEASFTEQMILPAIARTKDRFGIGPQIFRLLPEGEELRPSWDHYPRGVLSRALLAAGRPVAAAKATV